MAQSWEQAGGGAAAGAGSVCNLATAELLCFRVVAVRLAACLGFTIDTSYIYPCHLRLAVTLLSKRPLSGVEGNICCSLISSWYELAFCQALGG